MVGDQTASTPEPRLWTIEEAGEYLRLSPSSVRRRIKDAGLPCRRIGDALRFVPDEVEAWVREQARAA